MKNKDKPIPLEVINEVLSISNIDLQSKGKITAKHHYSMASVISLVQGYILIPKDLSNFKAFIRTMPSSITYAPYLKSHP